MRNEKVKYYFFLGIGGIGMSALARFLWTSGYNVLGYDAVPSQITSMLEQLGIKIFYEDSVKKLPRDLTAENTLVVLTPAIKKGYLLNYFQDNGFHIIKRAQLLGQIANEHPLIAISGTHGKTSTTAIASHILSGAGLLKAGFVGGVVKNYNSNLILPSKQPENGFVVVEADEYDRSFLQLHPDIAVVTSIEADHLDIYKDYSDILHSFEQFISGTKPNAQIILNQDLPVNVLVDRKKYTYGLSNDSDFYVSDIKIRNHRQHFTLHLAGREVETFIQFPGKAYLLNSIAAAAVAFLAGVDVQTIARQLQTYQGTQRRFDLRFADNGRYIYDDYAHHPSELKALYQSIRQFFPDKKVTIVFQPHLYSRTRDFAKEFARALDAFEEVIITDIYPAREKPIDNVSAYTILERMTSSEKRYIPMDQLTEWLSDHNFEVLLVVGAGDVNKIIEPLTRKITNR